VVSAFVVRVERVPSPAVFGRRTVVSPSATPAGSTSGGVHLVSLTSELPEPAGERTGTSSAANAGV